MAERTIEARFAAPGEEMLRAQALVEAYTTRRIAPEGDITPADRALEILGDMLTDLFHLAGSVDLQPVRIVERALFHYEGEVRRAKIRALIARAE